MARMPHPTCRYARAGIQAVVFDHVSLAFDDHVVLRELSFEVAEGAMTVLLGASGTGKSVVLKLILDCCARTRAGFSCTASGSTTCPSAIC